MKTAPKQEKAHYVVKHFYSLKYKIVQKVRKIIHSEKGCDSALYFQFIVQRLEKISKCYVLKSNQSICNSHYPCFQTD